MDNDNNNDVWTHIDHAWHEIDRKMTHEEFEQNNAIKCEEWIWFDDVTMYGSCMCINSRDTCQYVGDTLITLLDHAVVNGNTYTLTNTIVIQGKIGIHTETPWSKAYSQFSQFAEWGYEMSPTDEYDNIHQIRTRDKKLDDFIKAGIQFSHIIIVEEDIIGKEQLFESIDG
jgi:hypothetical protein